MSKPTPSPRTAGESLLLPASILTAIGALALILLTVPLAALLSGHGMPHPLHDPATTIFTTFVDGPAAAWTHPPAPWLMWTVTALTWGVVGYAGLWLWRLFGGGRHIGGAQWGGARVERVLAVHNNPIRRPNQITAGRGQDTGRIVAAEPHISATAFGVPGSSKTTGLLLPNAAEWCGPLVVTTTKAADLDIIYKRRRALGPVWIIAPAGIPNRKVHRWSPVDYCTDAKAADRMAAWMAEASAGDSKRDGAWIEQARSVLKGILLAAHLSGGGITAMRRWLSLGADAVDHVRTILEDHGETETAEDYASPWLRLHEDGIGSIQFVLNVLGRVYADEEVRASAAGTDFTTEQLLDECGTVCLIAGEADADRFAPLITSIIASIIHGAETRYNATGEPLSPALGVLVDEAGNMLKYPRLPNILTTGRGMGIVVLTIWHDLSQLRERLGAEKANTVMSASGLRMLLPGCGDLETLKYFSGLYGRTEVRRASHSYGGGQQSISTSIVETDLAPVHALQQLPRFTAVAQYTNRPPITVRMRLTFRDKDLKAYLGTPVSSPPVSLSKPARGSDFAALPGLDLTRPTLAWPTPATSTRAATRPALPGGVDA
jgi:type IV secretion system protein VirD4